MDKKKYERQYAWRKENEVGYNFTLSKKSDADVIQKLSEVPSKRAYIVSCVRKCIELEKENR